METLMIIVAVTIVALALIQIDQAIYARKLLKKQNEQLEANAKLMKEINKLVNNNKIDVSKYLE